MENKNIKIAMNNAIKHFEIHAAQRIHVLNFYIVLESLFVTGILAIISSNISEIFGLVVSIGVSFFAICFYLMDKRMKYMIKSSEEVLQNLESKINNSDDLCIFTYTENKICKLKEKKILFPSWSKILNVIYLSFFIIGILCIIYFILMLVL